MQNKLNKIFLKLVVFSLGVVLAAQSFGVVALQTPTANHPLSVGSPVTAILGKGSIGSKSGTSGKQYFSFQSSLKGGIQKFYLYFPTFGGVRLTTEEITNAVFEPESYYDITVSDSNGLQTVTAGDMTVYYRYYSGGWDLSFQKYNGSIYTLSSTDLVFGYESSGYRNTLTYKGTIADGEKIYGSGERYNGFSLNGKDFLMWNNDGYSSGDTTADRSLSYVNVPIFHSTTGYSIYFNSSYNVIADIGKTDASKYTVQVNYGENFDLFLWNSSPLNNIKSYTTLTGKPFSAPEWAYHYQIGSTSNGWGAAESSKKFYSLYTLKKVLDKYKNMGTMPYSLYGEGYPSNFEDGYSLINSYGVKTIRWNYPDMSVAEMQELLPDIVEADLPVITYPNENYQNTSSLQHIDFTNPNSVNLIKNYYGNFFDWGCKGAMVDFGEMLEWYCAASNGMNGQELHNLYPYYYNKAMNEAFDEGTNGDFLLFARAGSAGSQAYAANFLGDQVATFTGLEEQLSALLSISASGFSTVGGDIGGYFGETASAELYSRWLQLGTFSPLMRTHGGVSEKTMRDPWNFGKEEVFKNYYYLRENIVSYIYSAALESNITGEPIIKAFALAFPTEANVISVEDQYMLGESVMVAPVITEGATSRDVVFPSGRWYDLYTGNIVTDNGGTSPVSAPEDYIPAYLKSGAVMPVETASSLKLQDEFSADNKVETLIITQPEKDTQYTHYTDAGNTVYRLINENDGYVISSETQNSRKVILYGDIPYSVLIDGEELAYSKTAGENYWYKDGDRFIINCSGEWKNIKVILNVHENGVVDSTRIWSFDSAEDMKDFKTYYWNSTGGYVEEENYTDSFNLSNSELSTKRGTVWNSRVSEGKFENITAVTFNDPAMRNLEVTYKIKKSEDYGYSKNILFGFREKTPGQIVNGNEWEWGVQLDGTSVVAYRTLIDNGSNAAVMPNAQYYTPNVEDSQYNTYKLRLVGNKINVWVNGIQTVTDHNVSGSNQYGYTSIYFANSTGAIDEISITKLSESGNEIDFYDTVKLSTAADLQKIGSLYPSNSVFKLTADIVIGEDDNWTPIADFNGTFDGGGHTIEGLTDTMFYSISGKATVKNLYLSGINSPEANGTDYYKGAVVNYVKGDVTIENTAVTGYIEKGCVGGIVGRVDENANVTLNNCSYVGTLKAEFVGGLIGGGSGSKIVNNSYTDFVMWCTQNAGYYSVDAPVTVINSYYKMIDNGEIYTNYSDAKSLATLGLPSEYWVHNGKIPQLKITGAENFIAGDVNLDKTINIIDLVAMKKLSVNNPGVNSSTLAANLDDLFDENGVATVSASDLTILRRILLGTYMSY